YKPDTNLIVDEELFPTKVRCKFTHYIVYISKPDKSGIKVFHIWEKKNPDRRQYHLLNYSLDVQRTIFSRVHHWRQNYWQNEQYYLGLFGKRIVPASKINKDELERFSTVLYKTNNCTLTIYKSKPAKKVTILKSEYSKQLYIITKPNSASMSPIKWQKNTVSNQNLIDGLFFQVFFQVSFNILDLAVDKIYPNNNFYLNSRRASRRRSGISPRRKRKLTRNIKWPSQYFVFAKNMLDTILQRKQDN
ncbi:LOW QUALITY PROTEIN: piggyBac transposable element-derived protein 4-like, partial [Vespula maculifrons]